MEEVNTLNNIASENIDFSMFALFMSADLVVKSVIIILILASVYSWTIIISKLFRLRQLKLMEKEFEEIFWSGNSFEDLYETLNFNKLDINVFVNVNLLKPGSSHPKKCLSSLFSNTTLLIALII